MVRPNKKRLLVTGRSSHPRGLQPLLDQHSAGGACPLLSVAPCAPQPRLCGVCELSLQTSLFAGSDGKVASRRSQLPLARRPLAAGVTLDT